MIELKVEDYCHNCPEFEAAVDTRKWIDAYEFIVEESYEHRITCAHASRCKSMYGELKKKTMTMLRADMNKEVPNENQENN